MKGSTLAETSLQETYHYGGTNDAGLVPIHSPPFLGYSNLCQISSTKKKYLRNLIKRAENFFLLGIPILANLFSLRKKSSKQ